MTEPKRKIAIIGGGTGLTLAWLLAEQFDVTLYEASDRLGGHAQTIVRGNDLCEAGFEFINPNYVMFYNLLNYLGMELRSYDMKMEFIDYTKRGASDYEKTYFSPSIADLAKNYQDVGAILKKDGCCSCLREVEEDSSKIENLALLQYAMYKYSKEQDSLGAMTTKEFVDGLGLPDNFGPGFYYPLTNASWGIDDSNKEGDEPRNAEDFLAQYTFYYLSAGNTYQEVVGGLIKYITALYEKVKGECLIKFGAKVVGVEQGADGKWAVRGDGFLDAGYDDVIICTSFEIAASIIALVPDLRDIYDVIKVVSYYTTRICLHENDDPDFDKDVVIHIKYTGNRASLHIKKPWNGTLTRSWVFKDEADPPNTVETVVYRHPNMTKRYYTGQGVLKEHNKKAMGVMFGGIAAGNRDSHEGAMEENYNIATYLGKKYGVVLQRLEILAGKKEKGGCACCGCC